MTIAALGFSFIMEIEVYAIPVHTSNKTKPLNFVLFYAYKALLNENLQLATSTSAIVEFY